jgi:hypothetical protein
MKLGPHNNMNVFMKRKGNWDSSVSIVTGYGLDNQGLIPSNGRHFFGLKRFKCEVNESGAQI